MLEPIIREPLTEEERIVTEASIDSMTQEGMARMIRFSPSGEPIFDNRNEGLYEYFMTKFNEKGGMTPTVSKHIGWEG